MTNREQDGKKNEMTVLPGTEGARRATGVSGNGAASAGHADPEVPAKGRRRKFTTEYRLKILREADRCKGPARPARFFGAKGCTPRCCRRGGSSARMALWRRCVQCAVVPPSAGRGERSGRSRIYQGIHFQFSNEDAGRAGRGIGREIALSRLRRCVGGGRVCLP